MTRSEQIWKSLEDKEYRDAFNADVDTGLAFQIRALREKNGWTQAQLGERAGGKAQETISQWENPNYGSYTLNSIKDLAVAFDVGLAVRFVPFSDLVEWNANLTPERIAPPSFDEERLLANLAYASVPLVGARDFTTQVTLNYDEVLEELLTTANSSEVAGLPSSAVRKEKANYAQAA
ncbi:MAG: helix-turn-helix transcriptional regulator [Dehalococcoidia bacterium]